MSLLIEQYVNEVAYAGGINTAKPIVSTSSVTVSTLAVTSTATFTGIATFTAGIKTGAAGIGNHGTTFAVNTTAAVTGANLLCGYLTSTSAAGVTITLPTGTDLGGVLGASRGTTFDFYVDNTAGANTVTMAVNTNAVQSDWDNQITTATASVTPATVTPLTVASGTSGIAKYQITFASATAYVFSRTA